MAQSLQSVQSPGEQILEQNARQILLSGEILSRRQMISHDRSRNEDLDMESESESSEALKLFGKGI